MRYDPIKSFTVISRLVDSTCMLLVKRKIPAGSAQALIALAKAAPDSIDYGSSGSGSAQRQRVVVCVDDRRNDPLKALALTTAKRMLHLPDVPTLQEAGVPG